MSMFAHSEDMKYSCIF